MNRDEVIDIFRQVGAVLEGHFILSSGLHSPVFLQKALVYQYPDKTERLCRALADKIRQTSIEPFDTIISPALGGLIPGYETARHLNIPFQWVERQDGEFALRRGFQLGAENRVLIIEDIISTGLSVRETIKCVLRLGAKVTACACLIDRSAGEAHISIPLIALAEYKVPVYSADALPPELAAIPAQKPGSRGLVQ